VAVGRFYETEYVMDMLRHISREESLICKSNEREFTPILSYFKKLSQVFTLVITRTRGILSNEENELKDSVYFIFYLSGIRSISMSKCAIDLAISGHPFEVYAINRMMLEMAQIVQYLSLHPDKIERYYLGKIKSDQIRKEINREVPTKITGKLFGLLSYYSHASSDILLTVAIQNGIDDDPKYTVDNKLHIKNSIYETISQLLGHYFSYRIGFHNRRIANKEIIELDKYLFNIGVLKKLFSNIDIFALKRIKRYILEEDY
jgi:hypothetical protein